ncbi:MAG: hypothetical protein ACK511_13115 [Burkholderiales bacterium]
MGKTLFKYGRTTPIIILMGLLASPSFAEPRGHWRFVDDGTGVELRSCNTGAATLCGVITQLPRSAAALPAEDRKALCGLVVLGDMQPAKTKEGELARLDGWADDIESMTPGGKARRYAASVVVLSENSARLDVRGAFGIVIDRLQLMRALTPITDCK